MHDELGGEGAGAAEFVVQALEVAREVAGQPPAQGFARLVDRRRISQGHRQAEVLFAGQGQQQGLERELRRLIAEGPAQGGCETGLAGLVGGARGAAEDQGPGQPLAGLPAIEQVRVAGEQDIVVLKRRTGLQLHRGRELAQGRDHRRPLDAAQAQSGGGLVQHDDRLRHGRLAVRQAEGEGLAVGVQQAKADRDRQGALVRLAGGRRGGLAQGQV